MSMSTAIKCSVHTYRPIRFSRGFFLIYTGLKRLLCRCTEDVVFHSFTEKQQLKFISFKKEKQKYFHHCSRSILSNPLEGGSIEIAITVQLNCLSRVYNMCILLCVYTSTQPDFFVEL